MTTSHAPNLTVNVTLDAPPTQSPSFQIPLLAVPLATNSLNGDRVRAYADTDDIAADETAGYISATTAAQLTDGLGQTTRPRPTLVKAGYVDLAGAETYDNVLPTLRAADPDFYGYAIQENTTGATAEAVAAAINAEGKSVFAFQSDDSDWITSGLPAAYADVAGNERTIGYYHDATSEHLAFAALCAGLQDPDSFSSPWVMHVDNVAAYTTELTAGQRALALANNINVLGEFGPSTSWLSDGVNCAGRTIRAIVMRDWLETRIRERAYALIVTLSNQLEPVPITPAGQNDFGTLLKQLIEEGINIGHFANGTVTYPAITATDVNNRRLRVEGHIEYVVDGVLVQYDVFLNAFVPN